jgi:hypothetical protein
MWLRRFNQLNAGAQISRDEGGGSSRLLLNFLAEVTTFCNNSLPPPPHHYLSFSNPFSLSNSCNSFPPILPSLTCFTGLGAFGHLITLTSEFTLHYNVLDFKTPIVTLLATLPNSARVYRAVSSPSWPMQKLMAMASAHLQTAPSQ